MQSPPQLYDCGGLFLKIRIPLASFDIPPVYKAPSWFFLGGRTPRQPGLHPGRRIGLPPRLRDIKPKLRAARELILPAPAAGLLTPSVPFLQTGRSNPSSSDKKIVDLLSPNRPLEQCSRGHFCRLTLTERRRKTGP